jgi:hypothetical protein
MTNTNTTPYEPDEPESKDDVGSWEIVASYVETFPSDGEDGACDVEVQIGEAGGLWFLRTCDDAGGNDDAGDTAYATRAAAVDAAEYFASERDEAEAGEDAADYLRGQMESRVGDADPGGEWACYWDTVGDGSCVEERYESREQAEAAVELANAALSQRHGGNLLCGYDVRRLVDGEWLALLDGRDD